MIMLDIAIACMLFATIVYLWRLNKKVYELRAIKNEFAQMIKFFDESILRAEMSIDDLKRLSGQSFADVEQKLYRAKELADDLSFMTDRANDLADKLDKKITEVRNLEKSSSLAGKSLYPSHNTMYNPYKENVEIEKTPSPEQSYKLQPVEERDNKKKAIQSLLERISSANAKAEPKIKRGADVYDEFRREKAYMDD